MFKRIRNRILLLNMVMASAVVIAAFAVIFGMTYSRVQNENRDKLLYGAARQKMISEVPFRQAGTVHASPGTDRTVSVMSGYAKPIQPNAGLSFSMILDSQTNIIEVDSIVDLPDTVYVRAAATVMEAPGGATVELAGRTWQYAIYPVTVMYMGELDTTFSVTGEFNNVKFLDVTDSHRMLSSLAVTLLSLTVVILVVFYFISRLFANRAIKPMELAWEKQGRFVADASHELKTPLSIINANCGVLYSGRDETVDSQIKWVDSIMRAADKMSGLIGGLLSLARMEDNQAELISAPFDLSEVLSDAVSEIEAPALDKDITINQQIEPDIVVESDKDHICQILAILLDNSVKYANSGGDVSVTLKRERRNVICAVRNTGGGIPPEDIPRLFDRFYRADPARSSENGGYGLGLAIAKAAAEQLDARITVDSKPGVYTEFCLIMKST